jgi:hypothetical protein
MANAPEPSRVVVFSGPSLWPEDHNIVPDATYLPPAEQGSFVRTVQDFAPHVVVLIDGSFGRVPAVRHKEILWTLAQGISVYGAGSMGALRAAELSDQGMIGFGLIYRWYRRIPLLDDDEVAVATTPTELGAKALGEALVNIRLTLRRLERSGIIERGLRRDMEAIAESIHFLDRNYENLFSEARAVLPSSGRDGLARLARLLPTHAVDQKRLDAVGLLHLLSEGPATLRGGPPFPFTLTEAWAYDLEESSGP